MRYNGSKHYKKSMRDKKLLYGIKTFNTEPQKGIDVLFNSGFLPNAAVLSANSGKGN